VVDYLPENEQAEAALIAPNEPSDTELSETARLIEGHQTVHNPAIPEKHDGLPDWLGE